MSHSRRPRKPHPQLPVRADRALVSSDGESVRFVEVEVQAPEAAARPGRAPVSLAFVLDRSGSMHGAKITHARAAIVEGVRALRADDRFGVVAYDDQIDVVIPQTLATPEARQEVEAKLARLEPRGNTDLYGGWVRGCEEAARGRESDRTSRCLLLTDGLANVGVVGHDEIVRGVAAAWERQVATSAFGVGADFDESLLRRMADAGGGNFHLIEHPVQIPDFITGEVGEALQTTARGAVLVVVAPGIEIESLNDFPHQRDGDTWRIQLGSLYSGQLLHPVLRLAFPRQQPGASREVRIHLEDQDGALGQAGASLRFTAEEEKKIASRPGDLDVTRRAARLDAARAERDALERNRVRDYTGARQALDACADRIAALAAGDSTLVLLAYELRQKAIECSYAMDDRLRKARHFGAHRSIKERFMAARARAEAHPGGASRRVAVVPTWPADDRMRMVVALLSAADPDLLRELVIDEWLWEGGFCSKQQAGVPVDQREEASLVVHALRGVGDAAVRIVVTDRPLWDNWFSHWHDPDRTAVVSVADFQGVPSPLAEAFLAYEIALHGSRQLGPAWTPDQLMHEDARGCLFDFCRDHAQIVRKLQQADLCDPCRQALQAAGVPIEKVARLAEVIRSLATPSGVVH